MPTPHAPAGRWSAAGIHLLISALLICTIALSVLLRWFPAGLYHVAGVQKLFGIMVAADVVLGPLLTLLVYKRGKRGMTFDLCAIGIMQAAFLAYGVHTLWQNRPLFLVGSSQAYALVFASELPDDAAEKGEARHWPRFHKNGPWLVGVDLSSEVAKEEFLFSFLAGNGGPLRDEDLYIPYSKVTKAVIEKARKFDPALPAKGHPVANLRTLPVLSLRTPAAVMLVDARTGQPLEVVR